jgi:hypothetical protein
MRAAQSGLVAQAGPAARKLCLLSRCRPLPPPDMAFLHRLSHLHPAPTISSPPPPALSRLLNPHLLPTTARARHLLLLRRHFAFSSAEEAAAERRLRIEPPLHALRRDSPPPQDPNGPRLPDTTSAFVGPRLSLHNRVQSLIRSGDLDGASATARAAVSSRVRPTVFTCNAVGAAPPATTTPSGSLGSSSAAPTSSPTTPSSSPTARPAVSTPRWRSTAIYLNLRPSPPHQSPTATSPRASSLPAASATPLTFSTRCSTAAPVLTPLSTTTSSPDTSTLVIGTRPSSSSMR